MNHEDDQKARALSLMDKHPSLAGRLLDLAGKGYNDVAIDEQLETYKGIFRDLLLGSTQEKFAVIALGPMGQVIDSTVLFMGGAHSVSVDRSVLFRWLLTREHIPSLFYVSHVHPGSTSQPSTADVQMTTALMEGSQLMMVGFGDHLVMGQAGDFRSIAEFGSENLAKYGVPWIPEPGERTSGPPGGLLDIIGRLAQGPGFPGL